MRHLLLVEGRPNCARQLLARYSVGTSRRGDVLLRSRSPRTCHYPCLLTPCLNVRWSRMSGRRTSGSSRPSLGVQVLAVFSFISWGKSQFTKCLGKRMSGKTPGSPRHPSSRHPRPSKNVRSKLQEPAENHRLVFVSLEALPLVF